MGGICGQVCLAVFSSSHWKFTKYISIFNNKMIIEYKNIRSKSVVLAELAYTPKNCKETQFQDKPYLFQDEFKHVDMLNFNCDTISDIYFCTLS